MSESDQQPKAYYPRPSMNVPAIHVEQIDLAPKACDVDDPHSSYGGCKHACWSVTWGYGGVLTQQLKLCDKHRDHLVDQLRNEQDRQAPVVLAPEANGRDESDLTLDELRAVLSSLQYSVTFLNDVGTTIPDALSSAFEKLLTLKGAKLLQRSFKTPPATGYCPHSTLGTHACTNYKPENRCADCPLTINGLTKNQLEAQLANALARRDWVAFDAILADLRAFPRTLSDNPAMRYRP